MVSPINFENVMKTVFLVTLITVAETVRYSIEPCTIVKVNNGGVEVMCTDNDLREVPRNLSINTTVLDLSGNIISNLTADSLAGMPRLRSLAARTSHLNYLSPDVFRNSTELRELRLPGNSINTLDVAVFSNTPLLEIVDLSKNFLMRLPGGLFSRTPLIFSLDLSYNKLHSIPQDLFGQCDNLTLLHLSGNLLNTLPAHLLSNCWALITLKLSSNRLVRLPSDFVSVLSKMTKLRDLSLVGNPWKCDCQLDSLVQLLLARSYLDRGATCKDPSHSSGLHVVHVMADVDCPLAIGVGDSSRASSSLRSAAVSSGYSAGPIAFGVITGLLVVAITAFFVVRRLRKRTVVFSLLSSTNV